MQLLTDTILRGSVCWNEITQKLTNGCVNILDQITFRHSVKGDFNARQNAWIFQEKQDLLHMLPSLRNDSRCLSSFKPSSLSEPIKFTLEASQQGRWRAEFVQVRAAYCLNDLLKWFQSLLMLDFTRCQFTSSGILSVSSSIILKENTTGMKNGAVMQHVSATSTTELRSAMSTDSPAELRQLIQ